MPQPFLRNKDFMRKNNLTSNLSLNLKVQRAARPETVTNNAIQYTLEKNSFPSKFNSV